MDETTRVFADVLRSPVVALGREAPGNEDHDDHVEHELLLLALLGGRCWVAQTTCDTYLNHLVACRRQSTTPLSHDFYLQSLGHLVEQLSANAPGRRAHQC